VDAPPDACALPCEWQWRTLFGPTVRIPSAAEKEATDRARSYFTGQLPSSPSIGILRDGQLVFMMPRRDIESREAPAIAADLKTAFDRLCGKPVPAQP
jgi:putative YphP/YqiW family bacilliredoxin